MVAVEGSGKLRKDATATAISFQQEEVVRVPSGSLARDGVKKATAM